jgi:hypothetical protein
MNKKPSVMKKEWLEAKKEAAFYQKQSKAYAAAIVALVDDSNKLKEDVAIGVKGLLLAKKYEEALEEIRGLFNLAFDVQRIVDGVLPRPNRPKKQHCNNGLQCLMDDTCPIKSCICLCAGCRP